MQAAAVLYVIQRLHALKEGAMPCVQYLCAAAESAEASTEPRWEWTGDKMKAHGFRVETDEEHAALEVLSRQQRGIPMVRGTRGEVTDAPMPRPNDTGVVEVRTATAARVRKIARDYRRRHGGRRVSPTESFHQLEGRHLA